MAMRRNQPNVHAKDLPVSGVTNSASFSPGEKRAISGAATCGSKGTAMASARKPAHRPSAASKRKRNNLPWGITADSSRGFRSAGPPSCGKMCRSSTELARAQRGHEVEVRLEAAVDLYGRVAGAEDALALAPAGGSGKHLAKEGVQTLDHPVIEAYLTQSAAIGIEFGGQVMQARQGREMLWRKAPIFHLGSNQHPVRNRLGRNACPDRPPIVEGGLG